MININWSTTLFQILNFAVMAFVLYKVFFKPVLKVLDERSNKISTALDDAERREREAKNILETYDQKLVEANELVISMKQQAQEELEQTKQQFIAEAQQEIQQMRDKAHKEIQQARSQAIHQHRLELGQLVTTLSARLIREAGGEAFQKATMEEFVARLESLPADQYQKMFLNTEDEIINIHLVSANELDQETLSQVRNLMQTLIEHPVEVSPKVNPALVAGATVRFGDVMIDGSLEGQLDNLRTQYIQELERVAE
ncbi:MAG: F0F1 ATP synthase subunit delta [Anaerolineae bacterium]|nr:F0F1 ATP synthase subunit delta [Anaerolineae bacterium]